MSGSLVLDDVGRRYADRWAVRHVSAALQPGQVTGFLGPNGAGKTTTMKLVAGLLVPTEGTVHISGVDVAQDPEAAKARLAYVPDRPYVPERLTARELLHYVAGLFGLSGEVVRTRGLDELARFGLAGREDDLLRTYSHGMRQRALLAASFMRQPELLLIDEPMVGLDPEGRRLIKRMLRRAAEEQGACVLMSTHTLDVVDELCDRVLVMNHGRLLADGTAADLRALVNTERPADVTLEDVFFALTEAAAD